MPTSPIDRVVSVNIVVSDVNPTQAGFGVPLVLVYHLVGVGGPLVRSYRSLSAVVSDGHDINGPVYSMASAMFSQNPRPPVVKVGRRTASWVHVHELVCTVATTGYVYNFTIALGKFITADITYTVPASSTTTTVMTDIAALIQALSGSGAFTGYTFTAVEASSKITFTAAQAGYLYGFRNLPASMTSRDVSLVAGAVADFNAVLAQDSAWYALACDAQSSATVLALATVIEPLRKIYVADTGDTACTDSGSTTDVMYAVRALGFNRTYIQYHPDNDARGAVALLSGRLTAQPGSDTWSFKTLRGVTAYVLTDSQSDAIRNKNGNQYLSIADVGVVLYGTMAGGEFADIVRGIDWLIARIQERVFRLFVANPKVAYTDPGIATIRQEIDAQLEIAASDAVKLIVPGSYHVNVPKAADVDPADRARRVLPNVVFDGSLQGAIHFAGIEGTVTP